MVKFHYESKEDMLYLQEAQFESIRVLDGTDPLKVFDYLTERYPNLRNYFFDSDAEEVIYELPYPNDERGIIGCSGREIREAASEIADIEISCFNVIMPQLERDVWKRTMKDVVLSGGYRLTELLILADDYDCLIDGCLKSPDGKRYILPFDIRCKYTGKGYKLETVDQHYELPEDVWETIKHDITEGLKRLKKWLDGYDVSVDFQQAVSSKS